MGKPTRDGNTKQRIYIYILYIHLSFYWSRSICLYLYINMCCNNGNGEFFCVPNQHRMKTKLSWFSSFVNKILWLKTTQDQTPKMIKQPLKKTKTENINCKPQCFGKSMRNQWDTFKFIGGHGCSCAFMGAHWCSCLFVFLFHPSIYWDKHRF